MERGRSCKKKWDLSIDSVDLAELLVTRVRLLGSSHV